jgi:hypothetical protein
VRLSDLPRRLPRMAWWGWTLVGWSIGAAMGAGYLGAVRRGLHGTPPRYVPQLDSPLWHGTDLARPPADGQPSDGWPLPVDPVDVARTTAVGLWAATQNLGAATDEDTAREWLAVCAELGADADTLARLWDEWEEQHRRTVVRIVLDPEDPAP